MNFNKCKRCGCFFVTDSNICPKCAPKDNFEMKVLKDYLSDTVELNCVDTICTDTGISKKNLDRFLKCDEFNNLIGNDNANLKMNL